MDIFNKLKPNPHNPRIIKDEQYIKLKNSLRNFPRMLELRPIIYDKGFVVLGGNMRLQALRELVSSEAFEIKADYFKPAEDLTEDEKKEFIIKDNVPFGSWDWDILANEWEQEDLEKWGLDLVDFPDTDEEGDDKYTKKIVSPIYEPSGEPVDIQELVETTKVDNLLEDINKLDIPLEAKEFLTMGAYRHYKFDYSKIADFYASASKEIQELMENSALVIVDYDKAIENGFIEMIKEISEAEQADPNE